MKTAFRRIANVAVHVFAILLLFFVAAPRFHSGRVRRDTFEFLFVRLPLKPAAEDALFAFMLLCGLVYLSWLIPATVGRIRNEREARRRALGQCTVCGYDLRASPRLCPECGRAAAAAGEAEVKA
jgi:hypothetical protein